jgi:1-acyl-sn-glycerol-3-phosphate acyltransferase/MFS family permease
MSLITDVKLLVRNHNFFKLWIAQIISALGDRLMQMALLGLISGKAAQTLNELVQLILVAALPGIFVSPFAAMALDRLDRRKLLIWSDVLRAVIVVAIPFAYFGKYGMFIVNALVFVVAMMGTMHALTHSTVLPQVVGRENLLIANSMTQATGLISTLVGFAVVGLLVRFLPTQVNFILDGCIYIGSAILMAQLTIPKVTANTKLRAQDILGDLMRGLRMMWADERVRPLAFLGACFWAVIGFVFIAIFSVSVTQLGLDTKEDADLIGFMISFMGAGMLLGAVAISRFKNSAHHSHLPYFILVALGLSVAWWITATNWWQSEFHHTMDILGVLMPKRFVPVLIPSAGLILVGIVGLAFLLPVETAVQRLVPDEKLGKIQGGRNLITGVFFCGAIAASGWFAQRFDAADVILAFGLGVAGVAIAWILLSRLLRYQLARLALNLAMRLLFRLRVEGLERVPLERPVIFVANRCGFMDAPTIAAATPRRLYFFVNRDTFERHPLRRWLRRLDYIPLSGANSQLGAVRRAVDLLKRGKNLVVFPETAPTGGEKLAAFSEGAALIARLSDTPLVPVAVMGLREVTPSGSSRLKFRPIRVRFGDPIFAERGAAMSREELTAELRKRIESLLAK